MALVGAALLRSMSKESAARFRDLIARFGRFAEASGVIAVEQVSSSLVERFIRAPARDGSTPAIATMHLRRSAIRVLFAEGRRQGLALGDPSLDMALPPRSNLHTRALTDDEIEICRAYSVRTLSETRQPAAWALARQPHGAPSSSTSASTTLTSIAVACGSRAARRPSPASVS